MTIRELSKELARVEHRLAYLKDDVWNTRESARVLKLEIARRRRFVTRSKGKKVSK